jgi:hypothetical protein
MSRLLHPGEVHKNRTVSVRSMLEVDHVGRLPLACWCGRKLNLFIGTPRMIAAGPVPGTPRRSSTLRVLASACAAQWRAGGAHLLHRRGTPKQGVMVAPSRWRDAAARNGCVIVAMVTKCDSFREDRERGQCA